MAIQTMLTLDQFLALPDSEDGSRYELSEGELITWPPPGFSHGIIVMNVGGILRESLDRKKYVITGGDAGLILKSDPMSATVRGADVAVHKREDVEPIPATGYVPSAPLLAVEVVSPRNTAGDLELKVSQYLKAGGEEVWVLYPDTKRLHLYRRDTRDAKVYDGRERFESVLGCEFDVAPFFEI